MQVFFLPGLPMTSLMSNGAYPQVTVLTAVAGSGLRVYHRGVLAAAAGIHRLSGTQSR